MLSVIIKNMVQGICELESTDTRVLLPAAHTARTRFAAVVIVSEDTDVMVLYLAFKNFIFFLNIRQKWFTDQSQVHRCHEGSGEHWRECVQVPTGLACIHQL